MPPLTAQKEASLITRLPANLRTAALNRFSANANAPGGSKEQRSGVALVGGRAQQAGLQRLAGTMGIYCIETDKTASLAYNVGGAVPASITVESGTPASTVIAANELDPVTWAAPGSFNLTVQVSNTLAGNAKIGVT
jgi:hypothetical protein